MAVVSRTRGHDNCAIGEDGGSECVSDGGPRFYLRYSSNRQRQGAIITMLRAMIDIRQRASDYGYLAVGVAGLAATAPLLLGITRVDLTHGGILPRMLAGCTLGAFVSEMLPQDKVSRALGANSGFRGLVIGTAFGALLPGGPFTAYPVASALLTIGADFGAVIAMVTSWVLIGYGRAISWELPILGTDFTIWRIITCLPIPVLAGALGRFFYVRLAHRLKLDGEGARETVKS